MARCHACGEEIAPRARFCSMCGQRVAAGLPTAGSPPSPSASLLPPSRPRPDGSHQPGGPGLASLALIAALALVALAVFGRGRGQAGLTRGAAPTPLPTTPAVIAPVPSPPTSYQELHLDVPAGGSYRLTFVAWPAGAVFEGYFVAAAALDFRVEQPDGGDLAAVQHVSGRYDFRYTVPEAGQYAVVFADRAAPPTAEPLTLVYRADPPSG